MNEKRFGCPHCGQHYTVESASQQAAITCVACGREFMITEAASIEADTAGNPHSQTHPERAAPPVLAGAQGRPRRRIRITGIGKAARLLPTRSDRFENLNASFLGMITPITILSAMALGLFTFILAVVVCPVVGYVVALSLCRQAAATGGRRAYGVYAISSISTFVLMMAVLGAVFISSEEELFIGSSILIIGAGLVLAFVVWGIAAIWCLLDEDRPSLP